MNKTEALARLDALEAEAAKLRDVINAPDSKPRLFYDERKLYVAMCGGNPSLLAGYEPSGYFRWHEFQGYSTEQGWASNHITGQAALDYVQDKYEVREFADAREGMDYFYKLYCAAHK